MSSIGVDKVLFSSLQDFLVCGPHKPLWCDLLFFRDYDTVDKDDEVCPTLYMPTELEGEQNAEKKESSIE